uniref:Uncharacterized protein LOC111135762 n=1 Tax=Crassostrea virginica TaxID=6565 RepID=A0A8B8EPE6_CRAVI|nr:uncharacterized protein LOC111135762 [Crassostrea virginica]
MVVNIPEGRIGEGDTVMSYRGPRPPDTAHHYYFLLYEQSHVINTNQTANYTNPPNSRFLFNISDFVSDQALSLVGVSWFIAKPDEFTRYQSVTSGGNVTSLCAAHHYYFLLYEQSQHCVRAALITDGGGHEAAVPVRESWAGAELAHCPPIELRPSPPAQRYRPRGCDGLREDSLTHRSHSPLKTRFYRQLPLT